MCRSSFTKGPFKHVQRLDRSVGREPIADGFVGTWTIRTILISNRSIRSHDGGKLDAFARKRSVFWNYNETRSHRRLAPFGGLPKRNVLKSQTDVFECSAPIAAAAMHSEYTNGRSRKTPMPRTTSDDNHFGCAFHWPTFTPTPPLRPGNRVSFPKLGLRLRVGEFA